MRQDVYRGSDSTLHLKKILETKRVANIFLVTGKQSYFSCGAEKKMMEVLANFEVERFWDFSDNPKIDDFYKGLSKFKNSKAQVIIAIGGGSVIDMAKLIRRFSESNVEMLNIVANTIEPPESKVPLIAIPTTAGSGSEATHFAVVYIDQVKNSIAHKSMLPDIVVIDPQFALSLNSRTAAISGADAFCQGIESYWSINATNESKQYAKRAIKLIINNLPTFVQHPTTQSGLNMMEAAHLAGKAINISKTTAPHAISYPMTAYFGIPHGQAASLTLADFLLYNFFVTEHDNVDKRGVAYVKSTFKELLVILDVKNIFQAKSKIEYFLQSIDLSLDFSTSTISTAQDIESILTNINMERIANNPRIVSYDIVKKILLSKLVPK
jgi:alcohol dehydrogenase class IV